MKPENFIECHIRINAVDEKELFEKINKLGAIAKMPIYIKPSKILTSTSTDDGDYYEVDYWIER